MSDHKSRKLQWYNNNVDDIIIILMIFRDTELNYGWSFSNTIYDKIKNKRYHTVSNSNFMDFSMKFNINQLDIEKINITSW